MLSEKSGVSTGTIDRMRRAEVNAGVDHLDGLAKAFGVRPGVLLEPIKGGAIPFRDLNNFETQLVTFFRQIKPDEQHAVLVALNDMIPKVTSASKEDPFPDRKRGGRGSSRMQELMDEQKKDAADKGGNKTGGRNRG